MSPSLLENLDIHPVLLDFSLGIEKWTDTYLESIERTLSESGIDTRSSASALHLPIIPDVDAGPSSSVTLVPSSESTPLPPRPLSLIPSDQVHPPDQQRPPPAKKTRFSKLSNEELELYGAHTPCAASQLHAARQLLMFCP